jgi:hypothetical protein
MFVSNNQIKRSYKHIVLRDFKEILLAHQILGHYFCSIDVRALHFFVAFFKDIFYKYFIKMPNQSSIWKFNFLFVVYLRRKNDT